MILPVPCKKTNPATTSTGCQLNSSRPPFQPRPSLKWRTHLSTKMMATSPAAPAADRASTKYFKFSISVCVRAAGRRDELQNRTELSFWSQLTERGHVTRCYVFWGCGVVTSLCLAWGKHISLRAVSSSNSHLFPLWRNNRSQSLRWVRLKVCYLYRKLKRLVVSLVISLWLEVLLFCSTCSTKVCWVSEH